ncbi:MAG: AAA family ATPase [Bryobacteraceae bacterium]|jgi:pilus assembly protein CpaE
MQLLTIGLAISDDELRQEARACARLLGVRVVLEQGHPVETLQLKRSNPDFLLIDAAPAGESLEDQVRRIKSVSPWVKVGVIHGSLDPDMILGAMRAGADEFIPSPVAEKLREALGRLAAQMERRDLANRPGGKVLGFVSAQGGCGGTTVACHLANELQGAMKQGVLLADLDLDSGLIAFLMKTATEFSVLDAIKNLHRLNESFWKGLVSNIPPSLDVIASPAGLAVSDVWNPAHFHEVLRLVRTLYGMVLVDLGRTLNALTLTLLDDLDELFLVSTPSITALYQAKRFIQQALALGFPRPQLRLVLNRVPKLPDFRPAELERSLGIPVYAELSDQPEELEEVYGSGALLPPNSALGKQFSKLAMKIAGAPEEKLKGFTSWFGLKKVQPTYQSI